jgi:hypothetical protein
MDTRVERAEFNGPPAKVADWGQVDQLIRRLDGGVHPNLILYASPTEDIPRMEISGGLDDRYLVSLHDSSGDQWTLLGGGDPAEWIVVEAGSQNSEVPRNWVIGLADVIEAARAFALSGQRVETLHWLDNQSMRNQLAELRSRESGG